MSALRTCAYRAAGIALWVGSLGWGGYVLGAEYDRISRYLEPLGIGIGAATCVVLGRWLYRRHSRRR